MITYKEFQLDNGLRVIVHEDRNTPLCVMNMLYNVGSRDENEEKTGFAHLFEHLMFGGSKHIPSYDEPLQKVGGENNAFTSPDITNYYLTLPANNIETGFWLESDRMLSLSFNPEVLEVQRKVVIEEFKQRYLNQPYGDLWLKLRPLAYNRHPYRWATIGKDIAHIEEASMADVKSFFFHYYRPNNAVLVVAGNIAYERVKELSQKWFGPIETGKIPVRDLPVEPVQTKKRTLTIEDKVPMDTLTKAFHMCSRTAPEYHATDLLSDLLGSGKSSRLYTQLVKKSKQFNSISCYITGSSDPGLLVVTGRMNEGVEFAAAEEAIDRVLRSITEELSETELEKVKNQAESTLVFGEIELLNRAMKLAYSTVLGDTSLVNKELMQVKAVSSDKVREVANHILKDSNSSVVYYHTNNGNEKY